MSAHDPVSESILIADDNEAVTQTFARLLRLEGVTVRTAVSAESALAEATEHRPDAIILDLRIPLIDGLDFLKRRRAMDSHAQVPVAILTGDYFPADAISAELKQLGAELTFQPLWLEDLVGLARTLCKVKH